MLGTFHGGDRVAFIGKTIVAFHTVLITVSMLKILWFLTKNTIKHFLVPNRIRLLRLQFTILLFGGMVLVPIFFGAVLLGVGARMQILKVILFVHRAGLLVQ